MTSTLLMVSLVLTWSCSDVVRSSSELRNMQSDAKNINAVETDTGRDIERRVTRSDVRATLGNKPEPGFWPARGRRSYFEDVPPLFWSDAPLRPNSQTPRMHWRSAAPHKPRGRLQLHTPLFAEEPNYVLLDRRDEPNVSPDGTNDDDPFWVARGRRRYEARTASGEGSLWAAKVRPTSISGLRELMYADEPFWAERIRKSDHDSLESAEDPFWPTRGKRNIFRLPEGTPRRRVLKSLSGNELCWAARGRRSADEDSRDKRGLLESLSAGEPFWAARGKRPAGDEDEDSQDRGEPLETISVDVPTWTAFGKKSALDDARQSRDKCCQKESMSVERPLWASQKRGNDDDDDELEDKRGRRGSLLDSLSAEVPFWAARGKKDSPRMTPPSPEDLLSQIRTQESPSKSDPWWPVRGKRIADTDSNPNPEDERFRHATENRRQNNTFNRNLAS
ncbi:uncharacterized protein LOC110830455 [Zootermopsis nevadensis]|uniref:uncharacterized protein LOC110830455 n=1 Tax=Zootermopsis nevadensis TaxID=136037 RepID=UPI000B8E3624|nr:uncharacterized protein LOC110830455 [Zootermopsis nevadensis]XP_021921126.1 uncharacterized protein LOC110830455 [Zootermopsis nevadensis]